VPQENKRLEHVIPAVYILRGTIICLLQLLYIQSFDHSTAWQCWVVLREGFS